MNRREQMVVTRLRIGHTNLTSMFMLMGQQPPRCPHCMDCRLTVEHILTECPEYESHRQRYNIVGGLQSILSNSYEGLSNVLDYVKAIGLFRKM